MSLLYSITIFLSAFCLFIIQPLIAKSILPVLGGTPAVWNTCMLTFQCLLLAGYSYAHFLQSVALNSKLKRTFHILVLLTCLVISNFNLDANLASTNVESPATWVILQILYTIGAVFLILSTTSPLLQSWFAQSGSKRAANPYPLYAASNLGSLSALLAYPFLIEPTWTISEQSVILKYLYLICLLLITILALVPVKKIDNRGLSNTASNEEQRIGAKTVFIWGFLSFLPSSLMLGLTTHVTTNIAAVPLFWIIPLAGYLITFILAFKSTPVCHSSSLERFVPMILIIATPLPFYNLMISPLAAALLQLIIFLMLALFCHLKLSELRPSAKHLTFFYLILSVGGAIGGLFNSILAPAFFDSIVEYPLILALIVFAWFLRPYTDSLQSKKLQILLAFAGLSWVCIILVFRPRFPDTLELALVYGLPALLIYSLRSNFRNFTVAYALLFVGFFLHERFSEGGVIYRSRNFYGAKSVVLDPKKEIVYLRHGTINHGSQSTKKGQEAIPLSYFTRSGPVGDIFAAFKDENLDKRVGIVGLGIGAMASYAKPNEIFTFFELDPEVAELAKNRNLFKIFTASNEHTVILGDGRLTLTQIPNQQFKLLFLDAFSSDAVPVHLLTSEAIDLYLTKLDPQGTIIFNISNQYMDFRPLLNTLASQKGLEAIYRRDTEISEEEFESGKLGSMFFLLSKDRTLIAKLESMGRWQRHDRNLEKPWSDHYSNILGIINF